MNRLDLSKNYVTPQGLAELELDKTIDCARDCEKTT